MPYQEFLNEFQAQFLPSLPPFIRNVLFGLLIAFVTVAVSFVVRYVLYWLLKWFLPTWGIYLSNAAQIAVLLAGLALIINVTGLIPAAVLLTIITLLTAGASLSASNLISDGLASIQILTMGYYGVGDIVTVVGEVHGQVESINAFSTFIRTREREKLIVGNGAVIDDVIHVHTGYRGSELGVRIPVCSDHNREEVVRLLLEVGNSYEERIDEEGFDPRVFHAVNSDSEDYMLVLYVEDGFERRRHRTNLSIAASNKLNEHGVEVGETANNRNEISGALTMLNQMLNERQTNGPA